MDVSTNLFGNFCVACLISVVGIITVVTIAVIAWVNIAGSTGQHN